MKTLKDCQTFPNAPNNEVFVHKGQLREVSIQWIKSFNRNINRDCKCNAVQKWIKHFFNLKDVSYSKKEIQRGKRSGSITDSS